ncbi:hypothetical protein I3842_08G112600 [Carya illinoinensis]|uniref:Uncharacterized protein n=1 Tax=Carya illinoinensis TaxID=32201 RepID=A0A922EEQ4_CARIL|nr:hypothetical protein I3842_08G112600 [Carya illinoinensis]
MLVDGRCSRVKFGGEMDNTHSQATCRTHSDHACHTKQTYRITHALTANTIITRTPHTSSFRTDHAHRQQATAVFLDFCLSIF